MRSLEKNCMGRGHTNKQINNDNTRTLRLLDQLGPEGRVGEKKLPHTGDTESLDRSGQYHHCNKEKKTFCGNLFFNLFFAFLHFLQRGLKFSFCVWWSKKKNLGVKKRYGGGPKFFFEQVQFFFLFYLIFFFFHCKLFLFLTQIFLKGVHHFLGGGFNFFCSLLSHFVSFFIEWSNFFLLFFWGEQNFFCFFAMQKNPIPGVHNIFCSFL